MRGRPEFYVRVMCPPYTAEDAEFLAERNKVLEEAVNRIAAENFELREDNRNLKESYRYLSTTRIEEKKELMVYCGEENTDGIVWKRYSCKDCYNQFCARRMLAGEETWPK